MIKEDPENDSQELRYSLRSLSNLPHNKVFIVGEKPSWVQNVNFIPVEQSGTKAQNVKNNMNAAIESELLSDDFIMMNDDFFIMKKIPAMPNVHFGPMEQVIAAYETRYPDGSLYIDNMKQLYEKLIIQGIREPISYELHTPMVLNKQKVKYLQHETETGRIYQFRSYYGNVFGVGGTQIKDVKVFVDPTHNDPEYIENPAQYLQSQTFLSATGGAFKRELVGRFVREYFKEKSVYEK